MMHPRQLSLLIILITALFTSLAHAMSPNEFAMTRNVAERGNAAAQLLLAIAFLNGDGGTTKNPRLAAHWFEQAALQGNGFAESRLADLYEEGIGVEPNLKIAADWRERAARRDNVDAQLKLGRMYLQGIGVDRDLALARKWLQRAAEGGDAEAAYLVSQLYRHGLGGAKDKTVAGNWLTRSASQGYLDAVKLLHGIKSFGQQFDKSVSREALRTLAADGDADAQYQLGLHFESGSGSETRDLAKAAEWFRRAAAQDHELAQRALAHVDAGKQVAAQPQVTQTNKITH